MKDYRELYKGVIGACASCKHARTQIWVQVREDENKIELVAYDGGKNIYCKEGKLSAMGAYVLDKPNINAPISECWEGI